MGQLCREPAQGSASGPGRPYAAVEQRANGRPGTPAEADQTPNVWSCEVRPLGPARVPRRVTDQESDATGDENHPMRLHGKCGRPLLWSGLGTAAPDDGSADLCRQDPVDDAPTRRLIN